MEPESEYHRGHKLVIHPSTLELLVNDSWEFAHAVMWNGRYFTPQEIALARSYIRKHYLRIAIRFFAKRIFDHLATFCKRILVAKSKFKKVLHTKDFHPCIWLNPHNPRGFSATDGFEKQATAHHCKHIKLFRKN